VVTTVVTAAAVAVGVEGAPDVAIAVPPDPARGIEPERGDAGRDQQADHPEHHERHHGETITARTVGSMRIGRTRRVDIARVNRAVGDLELPDTVWKACPWQPRELIEIGLRQWLRCAGAALRDGQVIGMPSHAVDEAWHGLILCTARYARFCDDAYGQFLHHHPDGGAPAAVDDAAGSIADQLGRTIVAWSMVAEPGEACVLWDLDAHVAVEDAWGIPADRVAAVTAAVAARGSGQRGQ
jgi:hypothetical protein